MYFVMERNVQTSAAIVTHIDMRCQYLLTTPYRYASARISCGSLFGVLMYKIQIGGGRQRCRISRQSLVTEIT